MSSAFAKVLLLSATVGALFLQSSALPAADNISANPMAAPTDTTFPSAKPPADLAAGEAADTTFILEVAASYTSTFDGTKYTVTSVTATVSATTTIRRPDDGTLKDHETGHADLNRQEYDRSAKKKTEDAFRGFTGQMFVGVGTTPKDRDASAKALADAELNRRIEAATNGIREQAKTLSDKYDTLTRHGESVTVNTEAGKRMAIEERDKAPRAGDQKSVPDPSQPFGGISDPAFISYNPGLGLLSFSGNMLLDVAHDPTDTILGRGMVQIQPLVFIGLQENGTFLLSDTRLQILDVQSGNILMDAFLFEVAYMPSSLPGFVGMIQSYLDVPPNFAGGINNTIGSDFLAGMDAVRDTGLTSFHFFVDQDLFDKTDLPGPPLGPIKGLLIIGTDVPVPEPGTWLLLTTGILGLLVTGWRRRKRAAMGQWGQDSIDRGCQTALAASRGLVGKPHRTQGVDSPVMLFRAGALSHGGYVFRHR